MTTDSATGGYPDAATGMSKRFDVFISHSSKDTQIANGLVHTLEEQGLRCWIAPRDITPGTDYDRAIVEGIRASRVLVLIFSGHSNESADVAHEVRTALKAQLPVVPFRIQDVPLSDALEYHLGAAHWLDAVSPPMELRFQELASALKAILSHQSGSWAPPQPAVPPWQQPRPAPQPAPQPTPVPIPPVQPQPDWVTRKPRLATVLATAAVAIIAFGYGLSMRRSSGGASASSTDSTANESQVSSLPSSVPPYPGTTPQQASTTDSSSAGGTAGSSSPSSTSNGLSPIEVALALRASQSIGYNVRDGYTTYGRPHEDSLPDGQGKMLSIQLVAGRTYKFNGFCEDACEDLDLSVVDSAGTELAYDRDPDAIPIVSITPQYSGTHGVWVKMSKCRAQMCKLMLVAYQR